MDNKQAILGFTEFFKGITGNQNLEIPSEIAEKCGIQAQADGFCDNDCEHCIWTECPKGGDDYKYIKEISKPTGITFEQADGEYISRTELLKAIDTWDRFGVDDTNSLFRLDNLSLPHYVPYIHYDDVVKCIKGMPSVKQEPKMGHWVKTPKAVMGEGYMWYCDKCEHQVYQDSSRDYPSEKYCPNCGAKMVEPQERSDKE